MPKYELTGTVKDVMDLMTFDSGFTKREFIVRTDDDKYPQEIKLECVKERAALLDDVESGQKVTVSFDLRGNEYKGRYFVNLTAWKIENAEDAPADAADDGPPLEEAPPMDDDSDDIPF